jgi:heat shock protein HslJ
MMEERQMKKWMIGIVALTVLALVLPGTAAAQAPEGCAQRYVVRPGDTLAKIAGSFYDNPWTYPVLIYATNQAASEGGDLQTITDPYLIEPGWTLCVPEDETALGAVDVQTLKNLAYLSEWTAEGTAALVDGVYSESAAPGSATKTVVRLHDRMAFGYTADGQQIAAVVLITDPGGSGTFRDLAVLTFEDGEPQHVASASLGDRVQIQSLAVEDGQIVVEMIAHDDDDPMCCPTQFTVARYALQEGELVQTSIAVAQESPALVGTVWQWERFVGGDDTVIEVDDPSRYTLTLNEDGTYQVLADCNRAGGGYKLDGAHLALLPGPMTLAECGPDSLYDEYISKLGDVRTYVRSEAGDQLVLNLFADAGSMFFRAARAVQLPESTGMVGKLWQWTYSVDADGGDKIEIGDPSQYTLFFDADGTFALQADCNRGRGTYSAEPGESGSIEILLGPLTRAACGPDSRSQELIDALAAAIEFQVAADGTEFRLVLEEQGGELVFAAVDPITLRRSLIGTPWKLVSYLDSEGALVDVLDGTEVTAAFAEDQMVGSAGCNNYFCSYQLDRESLTFGPAGATRKMCGAPKGIMEQEQAYLAALASVVGYQIEGERLAFLDAEGAPVAVFGVQE